MSDLGKYTVSVTKGTEKASAEILVQRRITMLVKETFINLNDAEIVFNKENIVMNAGEVLLLGHTLADVVFNIDARNGEITVGKITVVDGSGRDVTYLYSLNTYDPDNTHNILHVYDSSCDSECNVVRCEKTRAATHSGGTATCKDSAICDVCGAHYGEIDAHNHASDKFNYVLREDNTSMHDMFHSCCNLAAGKAYHSGGTATCAVPAVCEHCGTAYGNTSSEIHSSSEFKYIADGEKHKKLHACCGEEVAVEEHNNAPATCMHGSRCELCGYEQGEKTAHVYDNECDYICNVCEEVSRAANFHVDENKDSMCDHCGAEVEAKGLSGGAISGIAVASVAVVGFGVFAIFWFAIKKKSFEALLKLLIG